MSKTLPLAPSRPAETFLRLAAALLLSALWLLPNAWAGSPATCQPPTWPKWDDFRRHFVQEDGRVVDASHPQQISTSEGQSYGMFFALVADDRKTFDRLWRWSVDNLAGGDITSRLPAWSWGKQKNGEWGVLDANSASDADLWFVYALLEAARLWNRQDYAADADALLAQVQAREVVELPGLGNMLLPGPEGFAQPGQWRLNPSYLPMPVLRRLALESPHGPWNGIADNTPRMLREAGQHGYIADWVGYRSAQPGNGSFVVDAEKGAIGSYDAIRTYLWAGMTPSSDPLAGPMMSTLQGMSGALSDGGEPPEKVRVDTGAVSGVGPFGFSAALLPYLKTLGQDRALTVQQQRVQAEWDAVLSGDALARRQPPYYDYVLSLFGTGWLEGRYRFHRTGRIQTEWEKKCPHAVTQ